MFSGPRAAASSIPRPPPPQKTALDPKDLRYASLQDNVTIRDPDNHDSAD